MTDILVEDRRAPSPLTTRHPNTESCKEEWSTQPYNVTKPYKVTSWTPTTRQKWTSACLVTNQSCHLIIEVCVPPDGGHLRHLSAFHLTHTPQRHAEYSRTGCYRLRSPWPVGVGDGKAGHSLREPALLVPRASFCPSPIAHFLSPSIEILPVCFEHITDQSIPLNVLFFHQCFQHRVIAQVPFSILHFQFFKEWSISVCTIIIANGWFYLVLFYFNGIMDSQISTVTFKVKTSYAIQLCFRYLKILICN